MFGALTAFRTLFLTAQILQVPHADNSYRQAPLVAEGTPVVNALFAQRQSIVNILRACIGLPAGFSEERVCYIYLYASFNLNLCIACVENQMLLEHKVASKVKEIQRAKGLSVSAEAELISRL